MEENGPNREPDRGPDYRMLSDDQWSKIEALKLPGTKGHLGITAKDTRRFIEAVLYRVKYGIPWRQLPPHFGHWHRVYVRFNRWSHQGVWPLIFQCLSTDDNENQEAGADSLSPSDIAMIDSTAVRAHRNASGARKKGAVVAMISTRPPGRADTTGVASGQDGINHARIRRSGEVGGA